VAGGSWGATLGILYAARRPAQVSGLLLRNPFLARAADLAWFFGAPGCATRKPGGVGGARRARGGGGDAAVAGRRVRRLDARQAGPWVQAWQRWECALAGVPAGTLGEAEVAALFRRYRLQLHYFTQGCFVPPDAVLEAVDQLVAARLPVRVVQGLADDVCPPPRPGCSPPGCRPGVPLGRGRRPRPLRAGDGRRVDGGLGGAVGREGLRALGSSRSGDRGRYPRKLAGFR
jgi:proline iminopeptidase